MKADGLSAWRAFLTAHARSTARVDRALLDSTGMPLEWWDVLLAVREAPGRRLRMRELAEHVLLSRSGLTRLADRLEAAGLLERQRCPNDRRGSHAVLTEKGLAELRRHWPRYAAAIQEHFVARLESAEMQALSAASQRLANAAAPISCTRP